MSTRTGLVWRVLMRLYSILRATATASSAGEHTEWFGKSGMRRRGGVLDTASCGGGGGDFFSSADTNED